MDWTIELRVTLTPLIEGVAVDITVGDQGIQGLENRGGGQEDTIDRLDSFDRFTPIKVLQESRVEGPLRWLFGGFAVDDEGPQVGLDVRGGGGARSP